MMVAAAGAEHPELARQDAIVRALSQPSFYGLAAPVEVRETHVSLVFLAGERAYKLKKAVELPFLDARPLPARRALCQAEVRLNARLSFDIYRGVRAVVPGAGGFVLAEEDAPEAVDYLVEMRRFDERETLASRLAAGTAHAEDLEALGALLAQFHARAPARGATRPSLDPLRARIDDTLRALFDATPVADPEAPGADLRGAPLLDPRRVRRLAHFCDAFLLANGRLLLDRARGGLVREGHADLRTEHVLLGARPQIVDCVEFDERLRTLDVGHDLAFLVMDLAEAGAGALAQALLDAYRGAGGDPGPSRLTAFFACERMLVRAKVHALRAGQTAQPEEAQLHAELAREQLAGAERWSWHARSPAVLVVCGPPASGKSALSGELADIYGLPILSSDRTRKALAGVEPGEHAGAGAYADAVSERTYRTLGREAGAALSERGGAIVDATFDERAKRAAFLDGLGSSVANGSACLFVECSAPLATLLARARRRGGEPGQVSDAVPEVVAARWQAREALDELPAERHVMLRTDRPMEAIVDDACTLMTLRGHDPQPAAIRP